MIKKTIQSFTFFAFVQILIFSCCDDTFNVYFDTIELIVLDELDYDTTTIASEDLVLNLNAFYEYVLASNLSEFKQFTNSAYATTCNEEYILKETLTNIEITSNVEILGVTAGNSINDKLSYRNPETLESQSVESIIDILNRQNGYGYYQLDLILNESIESETSFAFTIQLSIEENSRILEATSEIITID